MKQTTYFSYLVKQGRLCLTGGPSARGWPERCESALQNPRRACGAPGAYGPWGRGFCLRFRLALAGHVERIPHALK